MNGFDKILIAGNIAQKPLPCKAKNGRDILFINIAVGKDRVNDDGTRSHYVTFIPAAIFGSKAAKLEKLLDKGTAVCVEAHHALRDKIKLSIIVDDIQIIGSTALSQQPTGNPTDEETDSYFGDIDDDF